MKRICFIVDSIFSIGGVQRVTAVIAKELTKDYDVTIVTFDSEEQKDTKLYGLDKTNIQYRFFSYPNVWSVKCECCRIISGLYLKLQPQSKWASDIYAHSSFPSERRNALIAELKRGHYDVIIGVHAPLAARLATLKKQLPKVKLFGWIHNSYEALFSNKSMYIGAIRKRHYVFQFRELDQTILLCKHDVESYHSYDHEFRPTFIYNPLTLKPGAVSTGKSNRFLAVGRFSHLHKGFDLLIEAFYLFTQSNADWCLDIVGEGVEEESYKNLIHQYELDNRVTIHPFTTNIQDYYSAAQVYVLSSRWEGFGLVLVEAMAHGLPVVSSDLPTSKEIMGDFGLYFRNGDIRELAEKLEEATKLDWKVKSKEAIEIAKRFEVDRTIEQWKQLIEE